MTIHLVRHGTTTTSGVTFAGRSDPPLTGQGRAEALAIADALGGRPIGTVVSSPLSRALDTAAPLALRRGLTVSADAALMEIDFGILEGEPKATAEVSLRHHHMTQRLPGGESLSDVWSRAEAVAARLIRALDDSGGPEIAVFGHYWINRMLHGVLTGQTLDMACRSRAYRPATGSVLTLPEIAPTARRG